MSQLEKLQKWFGNIISRPLTTEGAIQPVSARLATTFVTPNVSLTAAQRLEIYNQQYWYRLLSCLHETFPLVVRLFGYTDFNKKIGVPYLDDYPPDSWSLNDLGDTLPQWLNENSDEEIVRLAAKIDWAYHRSFIEPAYPSVREEGDPRKVFASRLQLQPHLFLLEANYDLLPHREAFLEHEVEYWLEADFPKVEKKKIYYAIYRNKKNCVLWKTLAPLEYQLLQWIAEGTSLEEAVSRNDDEEVPYWIQHWVVSEWLERWSLKHSEVENISKTSLPARV